MVESLPDGSSYRSEVGAPPVGAGAVVLPTVLPIDASWRRRARGRLRRPVRLVPRRGGPPAGGARPLARPRGDDLRLQHPGDPRRLPAHAPRAQEPARRRRGLPGCRRHPDVAAAPAGRAGGARRHRVAAAADGGQPGLDALRDAHLHARGARRRHALHEWLRGARHGDAGGTVPGRLRGPVGGDVRRRAGGARRGRRVRGPAGARARVRLPRRRRARDRGRARGAVRRARRRRSPGAPGCSVPSSSSRSSRRRCWRDPADRRGPCPGGPHRRLHRARAARRRRRALLRARRRRPQPALLRRRPTPARRDSPG